ncbi:hypothetical protein FEE96_05710 [Parasedimentitalea maritima]|uniref:AlgX/AlgJ SGNH hydrolase-like domain-containing protein n=2 Tax=Parasedimentitalea maritima TaxID=2578117 RepID=A0ABY2V0L6_9RHOB|nr:hypothetical protein FEE96_05710 [Zongyanglinia marina]
MTGNMVNFFKCNARVQCAALLLSLFGAPLAAQSSEYACSGLMNSGTSPSVEGSQGMFYSVSPDLMMSHEITEEIAQDLAELSDILAAQGTTLIYLATPTKALGQPQNLPWAAVDLGYDIDIAATVYDENIQRLNHYGVAAPNVRHILARAAMDAPVFFGPDPRLNSHGVRTMVRAAAEMVAGSPGYAALPQTAFRSGLSGKAAMHSDRRLDLQEHCEKDLPGLIFDQVLMRQGAAPQDLFNSVAPIEVAVVSSEMTGGSTLGFAHHLQEATGLSAGHYSLAKGGSLAAMTAYLTSQQFQANRPSFLIWEQPIWKNSGEFGEQPLRELITAAGPSCEIVLPLRFDKGRKVFQADLSGLDPAKHHTLFFDNDGVQVQAARFIFAARNKSVRARTVYRTPDQVLTGRFYMPVSGLWPEGASHVDVQLGGGSFGPAASLTACQQEEAY